MGEWHRERGFGIPFVKMRPTFSFRISENLASWVCFSSFVGSATARSLSTFFIMVFLPMRIFPCGNSSVDLRMPIRIVLNCFDVTLSQLTTTIFSYSSR